MAHDGTSGVYNTTLPTLTNGGQVRLQVDASGRLLTASGSGTAGSPSGSVQTVQSPGSTFKQQTIANGTAITATGFDVGAGAYVTGILMPAAWTAASLTFQVSIDSANFFDLYDNYGAELVIPAAASRVITVPATLFLGFRYIKVRSGPTASPINQGADRTITLIVNS